MKMKAALMYGPNDIRVEETDKPTCPEDGHFKDYVCRSLWV